MIPPAAGRDLDEWSSGGVYDRQSPAFGCNARIGLLSGLLSATGASQPSVLMRRRTLAALANAALMLAAYSPFTPLTSSQMPKPKPSTTWIHRLFAVIQPPSHGSRRVEAARDHGRQHQRHPGHHERDHQDGQRGQALLAEQKPSPGNQGKRRDIEREGREVRRHATRAREEGSADAGRVRVGAGWLRLGGRTSARSPTATSRTPKPMLRAALRVSLVEKPVSPTRTPIVLTMMRTTAAPAVRAAPLAIGRAPVRW
jgi:hypothetical protein